MWPKARNSRCSIINEMEKLGGCAHEMGKGRGFLAGGGDLKRLPAKMGQATQKKDCGEASENQADLYELHRLVNVYREMCGSIVDSWGTVSADSTCFWLQATFRPAQKSSLSLPPL